MTNIKNILIVLTSVLITACAVQQKKISIYELEQQASHAYVNKKWKVAEEKYSELISISPGTAEIWFRLGNIYAHTKQPEKAISAYQEAVIRRPAYEKAWHNLGLVSLQQTTATFLEMLNHLKPGSARYDKARQTADELIRILERRRQMEAKNLSEDPEQSVTKQKERP